MESKIKKFSNSLRQVRLTPEERAGLRARLIRRMSEPVASVGITQAAARPVRWLSLQPRYLQAAFASFILVASLSAVVAAGAQRALPGELLYPVKVGINENVARLLTVGSLPAIENFETKLVERRLIEAERLSEKKSLTPEQQGTIEQAVINQTVRAARAIEKNRIYTEGKRASRDAVTEQKNPLSNQAEVMPAKAPLSLPTSTISIPEVGRLPQQLDSTDFRDKGGKHQQDATDMVAQIPERLGSNEKLNSVLEKHQKIIQKLNEHRPTDGSRENGNQKKEQGVRN